MPMVKYRDCLASELAAQEIIPGSLIVCRDTGDMIYDSLENERVPLAKGAHIVTGKITDELFPQEGHLYYSTTDTQVCVYHSGAFQPINLYAQVVHLDNLHVSKSIADATSVSVLDDFAIGTDIISAEVIDYDVDRSIIDLKDQMYYNFTTQQVETEWNLMVTATQTNTYDWIGHVDVAILSTPTYVQ